MDHFSNRMKIVLSVSLCVQKDPVVNVRFGGLWKHSNNPACTKNETESDQEQRIVISGLILTVRCFCFYNMVKAVAVLPKYLTEAVSWFLSQVKVKVVLCMDNGIQCCLDWDLIYF